MQQRVNLLVLGGIGLDDPDTEVLHVPRFAHRRRLARQLHHGGRGRRNVDHTKGRRWQQDGIGHRRRSNGKVVFVQVQVQVYAIKRRRNLRRAEVDQLHVVFVRHMQLSLLQARRQNVIHHAGGGIGHVVSRRRGHRHRRSCAAFFIFLRCYASCWPLTKESVRLVANGAMVDRIQQPLFVDFAPPHASIIFNSKNIVVMDCRGIDKLIGF
ncbi:hypothetical protein H257_08504 [Aphanomyces astaci]|uniref:Uncharacterized protein n=1 Tax=Aphanomyces astaci TaxID=112090 RepID=W4GEW6_APHAT|nr:hypothetical protein H257_08504 [Aphanomyces astaci]ETV77584.1 hypothetical protein H257_08504 [Aphanomyces astaci]|eukprot:XP_009832694.1 hypothetical protein H257_08504 [Aphanomyces astaci]